MRSLSVVLLALAAPVWADLQPMEDSELTEVSGYAGANLTANLNFNGPDIAYKGLGQPIYTTLGDISGRVSLENMALDVVQYQGDKALSIGLPNKVSFNNFKADLYLTKNLQPNPAPNTGAPNTLPSFPGAQKFKVFFWSSCSGAVRCGEEVQFSLRTDIGGFSNAKGNGKFDSDGPTSVGYIRNDRRELTIYQRDPIGGYGDSRNASADLVVPYGSVVKFNFYSDPNNDFFGLSFLAETSRVTIRDPNNGLAEVATSGGSAGTSNDWEFEVNFANYARTVISWPTNPLPSNSFDRLLATAGGKGDFSVSGRALLFPRNN